MLGPVGRPRVGGLLRLVESWQGHPVAFKGCWSSLSDELLWYNVNAWHDDNVVF